MAVTSPSAFFPSLQGPKIDESLFVNAAATGVGIGQATPSTTSALVQGGIAGVQLGMSVATGVSNLQSAAVNREATQAQTEAQRQQNEIGKLEEEARNNNKEIELQTYENKVKIDAETSRIKLEDLTNSSLITELLGNGTGEQIGAVLQDPRYSGTLARNPELASQVIGAGRSRGTDPSIITSATSTYDAFELQRATEAEARARAKAEQSWTIKNQQKFDEASGYLQSFSGLANEINNATASGTRYDASNVTMYRRGEVTTGPDGTLVTDTTGKVLVNPDSATLKTTPGYVLANGNKIIEANIPVDEGPALREKLNIYKAYSNINFKPKTTPPTPGEVPQASSATQMDLTRGSGLDQAQPTNTSNLTASGQSKVAEMQARSDAALKAMGFNGASYVGAIESGRQSVKQQQASVNSVPYTNSTQTAPQSANGQLNTLPVTKPTDFSNSFLGLEKISESLGGAGVVANFDASLTRKVGNREVSIINQTVANRLEAIPAVANKPALFKGLVAVESGGNPNARSSAGAKGLTQLMPGTANDLGVSPNDVYDPTLNAEAGAAYLDSLDKQILKEFQLREQVYRANESKINTALSEQSIPQQVDPRLPLLAFNGGPKWVVESIRKGNTTYDEILEDIRLRKSPEAFAENSAYPDKVIAASLPLIKGGNASDDNYIQTLINFGIISVDLSPVVYPELTEKAVETTEESMYSSSPEPTPLTGDGLVR